VQQHLFLTARSAQFWYQIDVACLLFTYRCGFRWNLRGWNKAYVVWSFIITTAIAVQKLAIIIGLDGLLPGKCISPGSCRVAGLDAA
jgi:hypothetical protein